MDVVFNHTAEGNENGPILSFRGIDNSTYYMLAPKVKYIIHCVFTLHESKYSFLCNFII
jgi:pullulanase/glycogen debranching enzyme